MILNKCIYRYYLNGVFVNWFIAETFADLVIQYIDCIVYNGQKYFSVWG